MEPWLPFALVYLRRWVEFQLRQSDQPGCAVAVVHKGKLAFHEAFGVANLASGERLSTQHRFRAASHSKSFTATGIMKLREAGRLKLDDAVGQYVSGLHKAVSAARIDDLLSHSAGLPKDGADATYFSGIRPYPSAAQLLEDLNLAPPIEAKTRFKYSNQGFALLGLVIEAITSESYSSWLGREVMAVFKVRDLEPDYVGETQTPMASGHSSRLPVGERLCIPGTFSTFAVAPAAGLVATAADLAKFFARLDPTVDGSGLTKISRREMMRQRWPLRDSSKEGYGLGVVIGFQAAWTWFGHSGAIQGYSSRTCVVPEECLTISVLTNAIDGFAENIVSGALSIFQKFSQRGSPHARSQNWVGRWWNMWGAVDLVAVGDVVLVCYPELPDPFADAAELEIVDLNRGRVAQSGGYGRYGEEVRRITDHSGNVVELWIGGARFVSEKSAAEEIRAMYRQSNSLNVE